MVELELFAGLCLLRGLDRASSVDTLLAWQLAECKQEDQDNRMLITYQACALTPDSRNFDITQNGAQQTKSDGFAEVHGTVVTLPSGCRSNT